MAQDYGTYKHFFVLTNSSQVFYGTFLFIGNVCKSLWNSGLVDKRFGKLRG